MNPVTRTTSTVCLAHATTSFVAVGLQLAGVYAAVVTFGVLLAAAIYVAGAAVTLLQHTIVGRIP